MSTADKIEQVILKAAGIGVAFWAILAAREAAKRKATADYYAEKEKGANGIGGTITPTGNEKTTIREAWKNKKENFGYVIFKDIAEPKESQVWCINYYDPSYREYVLYNCEDTSKEKFVKGDKVCFTGFYY